MKLNFIQNLSDEVIRQNHQLKNQVVLLNQKLNNYEQEMAGVIATIQPSTGIYQSTQQLFGSFIGKVKLELKCYSALKVKSEHVQNSLHKVSAEMVQVKKELEKREVEEEERIAEWIKERQKFYNDLQLLQQLNKHQKQTNDVIKQQLNDIKAQKLRLEELQRKDVEQMMLEHHYALIEIKTKLQKEHLKVQKQLRGEIETKNQTIKQMSKFIEQLKTFQNHQLSDPTAIEQVFKKLEKYNDLSKVILEVRAENAELREQKKTLENQKTILQAKLREAKLIESNLLSQAERLKIYQQQIQDNLMIKTTELLKSEKDKQDMQKYYAERWNSEYKRVKHQLGKDYIRKIATMEQNFKTKIAEMEEIVKQAVETKGMLIKRNDFLENIYDHDQNEIKSLHERGQQMEALIYELRRNIRETDWMNTQDLQTRSLLFGQQRLKYEKRIIQFRVMLEDQNEKLMFFRMEHFKKINQLQKLFLERLQQQKQSFENEKSDLLHNHKDELKKIKDQVNRKSEYVEEMKISYEKNFEQKLVIKEKEFVQKMDEKEEEIKKREERWTDKYREMQIVFGMAKKKQDDVISDLRVNVESLEQKNAKLWQINSQYKQRIQQLMLQTKDLRLTIEDLSKDLSEKKEKITQLQKIIRRLTIQLQDSKREVDALFRLRNQWKTELINVQFQFKEEFEELKKQVEKQKNILRQKIHELEDMSKHRMVDRRQYQQLKLLNQQKKQLRDEVHVKQVENVILTQVKDYYETKLKDTEQQIGKYQFRATHSIMARKIKKNRIKVNDQYATSQKVFEHPKEVQEWGEARRYAINSYRKNFNLSLSKEKLQESNVKNFRVKTSYAI